MNKLLRCPGLLGLGLLIVAASLVAAQAPPAPPKTRTDNVKETLHGVEIVDPYRWLEDQQSPETREWIKKQNEYTDSVLHALPGRDRLKERVTELMKIDSIGMPMECGGRYFFTKRLANQDLAVIYVREGLTGKDEVLVDPHLLSADKMTSVSILDVSNDGKLMAYGIRQGGEDEVAIQLYDVDARKEVADRLPKARYFGVAIKPDKTGYYYSRHGKEGSRVFYHSVGRDVSKDEELFGKGYGPDKLVSVSLSENGKHLLYTVAHGSAPKKVEIYYQSVAHGSPVVTIVNDLEARFAGRFAGDTLYLQTNWEAPNSRILAVDVKNPGREHWKEVIATDKAPLQSFSPVGGKLFVTYLDNVTTRMKVFSPDGKHLTDVAFPTLGTATGLRGWWDKPEGFYAFSSFLEPSTIYRYDAGKGTQDVWARIQVPIKTDDFEVKQVWYESKDKTKIPMFLVHKKGLKLDGTNPTYLTGYGGFNISRTPGFSTTAALWVEMGGVFALPNLRGGGEFGEEWHQAGMLEKKQNVFDDFITAAEYLIANKYTSSDKLAIAGGSNGGLLVGAFLTQRPELCRAVICAVPLLDMVRYHQFLVARFWVPEYGSSEDPAQFKYLHAYSPYHRVVPGTKYPAVMFVSGDSDTRVDPLHARKMCALLQAANGGDRPILLHYDVKSGHSGGKPVSRVIEDAVDEMSFLAWQLGMTRG